MRCLAQAGRRYRKILPQRLAHQREPNNGGPKKYIIELNVREFEFLEDNKKNSQLEGNSNSSASSNEDKMSIF